MTFKRLHRSQKELKLNLVEILDSIYFGDYSSIYQTKEDFRRIQGTTDDFKRVQVTIDDYNYLADYR